MHALQNESVWPEGKREEYVIQVWYEASAFDLQFFPLYNHFNGNCPPACNIDGVIEQVDTA